MAFHAQSTRVDAEQAFKGFAGAGTVASCGKFSDPTVASFRAAHHFAHNSNNSDLAPAAGLHNV